MSNKKDIDPTDKKGKHHGYHEWYWGNGKIWLRGKYIHGDRIGYHEWHSNYKSLDETNFYIR